MARPNERMFSIKLVHPDHLNHLKHPYLTDDFDGKDGRLPLMNFSATGRGPSIATSLAIGHRSLVYVIHHQKFVWAIEYIGTLEDGQRVAAKHNIQRDHITQKWGLYRPIRFLGRVPLATAPTAADINKRTGINFKANSFTLKYISQHDYQTIYDAIAWNTRAENSSQASAMTPASLPSVAPTVLPVQSAPAFKLPPIPDATSLLERIRQVQGLPERNMEDVVKDMLILLGHPKGAISFQIGRVDVHVADGRGGTRMVVEVKKSLLFEKVLRDARRKGFDYAAEVGAPLVILTDADTYEIYDRRKGLDHKSMLVGRFQLTKFLTQHNELIDLLRPEAG